MSPPASLPCSKSAIRSKIASNRRIRAGAMDAKETSVVAVVSLRCAAPTISDRFLRELREKSCRPNVTWHSPSPYRALLAKAVSSNWRQLLAPCSPGATTGSIRGRSMLSASRKIWSAIWPCTRSLKSRKWRWGWEAHFCVNRLKHVSDLGLPRLQPFLVLLKRFPHLVWRVELEEVYDPLCAH